MADVDTLPDYEYLDDTPTEGGWPAFLEALGAEVDYLVAGDLDAIPARFVVVVDDWDAGTVRRLADPEEA
jgi:hypothetical protein